MIGRKDMVKELRSFISLVVNNADYGKSKEIMWFNNVNIDIHALFNIYLT